MASEEKVWWYAKNGQRFGPYMASEIKGIAAHGNIAPTDLIWKEGLPKWIPASSVKGLIPVVTTAVPPPIPQQHTLPPKETDELPQGTEANTPNHLDSTKPAYWNPIALSNWSFFLTPVFGAYLVAKNYDAMGKTKEAKKSMEWLYISLAIMLSVFLLKPFGKYGFGLLAFAYLANFLLWNFRSARKQNREILAVYGKDYERQPWGKVLVIGIAANIVWQFVIARVL